MRLQRLNHVLSLINKMNVCDTTTLLIFFLIKLFFCIFVFTNKQLITIS